MTHAAAPRRASRALTVARVACGLVAASTLLGGGPARAQESGSLGGYTGRAAASGLHATYMPEGLLPTGAPLDLGVPDALATISSGPSTFARASVADPGDLLANPDALLSQASSAYKSGTIPAYPYRAEASSGVGEPVAESNPAPGLSARVEVGEGSSAAQSSTPAVDTPAVATIGSMKASAATHTDGTTVTVHSRTELGKIDVLGIITIDSVVTDLTATSHGDDTELSGGTTVTNAKVLGQPAEIDDEGIRSRVAGVDLGSVLDQLGITVTLPGPVELDGDEEGQLASTGLRIDIAGDLKTAPGLTDVLDAIPPMDPVAPGAPSAEDVLAAARAKHLVSIELGRGMVSLRARSSTPRVPFTPARPSSPLAQPSTPGALPSLAPALTPAAPAPTSGPAPITPTAPVVATTTPTPVSVGAGIGALTVLLLLLQPFLGDRLARGAGALLATDQEGCPWERR